MPLIECNNCGTEVRALITAIGRRHCPSCGELLPAPIPGGRDRSTDAVAGAAAKARLPLNRRWAAEKRRSSG